MKKFTKDARRQTLETLVFFLTVIIGTMIFNAEAGKVDNMKTDEFGGNNAIKGKATGFFHIEEIDKRYFLITPKGNGYRALGINHFHNMTSKDYDKAIENIKAWGFNAGCYQGPRWMWQRYPYTKGINLVNICQWMPDSKFGFKDVFDPGYLERLEKEIRDIVKPQANNAMLIGYFWTDVPLWKRQREGRDWLSFFKDLPKDSAGGKEWAKWRKANPKAPESDFLPVIAKHLYSKAHELLRKYDKNYLIFGDRYHEIDMPKKVTEEALPYIDAIAIQPTSKEFNLAFFDRLHKDYGKPVYIADHVSSFATAKHPITMGQTSKDPKSYVAYYEKYVTAALSRPYIIGYNKCQYQDEPAPGMLKQGLMKRSEELYPTVKGVTAANIKALEYAYSGTEPEGIGPDPDAFRIVDPAAGDYFPANSDITISATANLAKMGGAHVAFYYMDEKWKLISSDKGAPFSATWEDVPAGDWDIYVAVHAADWKLLEKAWINVSVGDAMPADGEEEPLKVTEPELKLEFDKYGGCKAIKGKKTGFFHLEVIDGRDYLVTPEGHGFKALGINHYEAVHPSIPKEDDLKPHYDKVLRNLKEWGFNSGGYHTPAPLLDSICHTRAIDGIIDIAHWMPKGRFAYEDVFDPKYLKRIKEHIRSRIEHGVDNPWLVGYFWTPYPLWERKRESSDDDPLNGKDWIWFFKQLPPGSPGGKVWAKWKKENPKEAETMFLALIARQLYSKTHEFIRAYDKNHLIFGERYCDQDMPEHVVRVALPFIDAIAIHPWIKRFDLEYFDKIYKTYGKPIYMADHGVALKTKEFARTEQGAQPSPQAYSDTYIHWVTSALSYPHMIGYNKCQYWSVTVPFDASILKQGLLKVDGTPYEEIIPAIINGNRKAIKAAYSAE